eukprot:CAMPEP_0184390960 /NCGR_PEP_ID=MMETSP0007-20130409/13732_1 /TAXON_ID=97485 /ORGANISM="Prymnesium parvum, Strain Texoma1" /LENGTH=92 /DNA_ID=CAMNT_0026740913 /DNA_START=255 /DNA_END=534 /DNA_ORIENTATION=-
MSNVQAAPSKLLSGRVVLCAANDVARSRSSLHAVAEQGPGGQVAALYLTREVTSHLSNSSTRHKAPCDAIGFKKGQSGDNARQLLTEIRGEQ